MEQGNSGRPTRQKHVEDRREAAKSQELRAVEATWREVRHLHPLLQLLEVPVTPEGSPENPLDLLTEMLTQIALGQARLLAQIETLTAKVDRLSASGSL